MVAGRKKKVQRAWRKRNPDAMEDEGEGSSKFRLSPNWQNLMKLYGGVISRRRLGAHRRREVASVDNLIRPFSTLEEAKANRTVLDYWPSPVVAIDCEMVESVSHQNMLARVAVVGEQGQILLDTLVKPTERVLDYRVKVTGLSAAMLSSAPSIESVRHNVEVLLRSAGVVVGHALANDFYALNLDIKEFTVRDTAHYEPLVKHSALIKRDEAAVTAAPPPRASLKVLSNVWLNRVIQSGVHDPIEDARAALDLYLLHRPPWEWELNEVKRLTEEKVQLARNIKNVQKEPVKKMRKKHFNKPTVRGTYSKGRRGGSVRFK